MVMNNRLAKEPRARHALGKLFKAVRAPSRARRCAFAERSALPV
jgi:hypothetical protein